MKLLCAQVLKDLLEEGIDVRVQHSLTTTYLVVLYTINSLISAVLSFYPSMTRLQSLLQMQSLVSLLYLVVEVFRYFTKIKYPPQYNNTPLQIKIS